MNDVLNQLATHRIVPICSLPDASCASAVGDALLAGGLPVAEVTFRTAAAEEAIRTLSARGDLLVGAGTVLTVEQADRAIDAGAQFVVAPGLNPKVVTHCLDRGVCMAPGVATPTDIERALELGLEVLKYFPAGAFGGIATIKAVSAPYGSVRFIPTGGVSAANLAEYLAFPKVLACGGSWIVRKEFLQEGDYDEITRRAREAVDIAKATQS